MHVAFKRTGTRRYAVIVAVPGQPPRALDPAPGYDDDIPHDLVHYVVEAELGFTNGVYGRAARGAGTFISMAEHDLTPRERSRARRKQQRRERGLGAEDERGAGEMAASERLAGLCDIAWRRRHGQRPDPLRSALVPSRADEASIERVVARLDALAPLWRDVAPGEALVFEWPHVAPSARDA
jgi:hypothetical protein